MQPTAPGIGVLTTDEHLLIRSWNDWLAGASGLREADVQGRSLLDLVPPESRDAIRDVLGDVLTTASPRVLAAAFHRYVIQCRPNTPSPHFDNMQQRVTVAPLTTERGVAGVMLTIEDVTARRDDERALAARLASGDAAAQPAAVAAVGAEDWRLRGAAVRTLRRSATREEVAHLLASLQRDHQDLNVLSSALQVLVATNRDVTQPLLELLADSDANLRMHAALALGELADPVAVPGLIVALDDADPNVRFHAIEALGRLRAPDAVEPLARIAGSGDFFLSFPAIDALARIDDAAVVPSLIELIDQDLLRPAVIDALAVLGDEDCVPLLVHRLNTGDASAASIAAALVLIHGRYETAYGAGVHIADLARRAVTSSGIAHLSEAIEARHAPLTPLVEVLGWMGVEGLPALVSALGEPDIEGPLAHAIAQAGTSAVVPVIERLKTGGREARLAAAALLGRLGDRRAAPALIELLGAPDAELTAIAASSLAGLGDADAIDALLPLFAHERASVRQAAIAAVNSIGADGTEARVRARLADRDPRVRECAIRIAAYFGFDTCVPGVVQAVADEDEEVRRAAIEQLPIVDEPRAVSLLLAALRDDTPRNRAAAARALRAVDDPELEAPLIAALDDADAWVRYFAADGLAVHGDRAALEALARAAGADRAPHVRIAAIRSLAVLDPGAITEVASRYVEEADDDLACGALAALAHATGAAADGLLERAVQSSRGALCAAAVDALAARGSAEAPRILAWAARIPGMPGVSTAAIEALRQVAASDTAPGRDGALAMLLELGADRELGEQTVAAMARLPLRTLAALAQAVVSPRVAVRRVAVEALARMRHRDASDALTVALADADASVRSAAVTAFGRLGTPGVAGIICRMREHDPDAAVRRRAAAVCRRHSWDTTASEAR